MARSVIQKRRCVPSEFASFRVCRMRGYVPRASSSFLCGFCLWEVEICLSITRRQKRLIVSYWCQSYCCRMGTKLVVWSYTLDLVKPNIEHSIMTNYFFVNNHTFQTWCESAATACVSRRMGRREDFPQIRCI